MLLCFMFLLQSYKFVTFYWPLWIYWIIDFEGNQIEKLTVKACVVDLIAEALLNKRNMGKTQGKTCKLKQISHNKHRQALTVRN